MPTFGSSNEKVRRAIDQYAEKSKEDGQIREFVLQITNLTMNSFERSDKHPYIIPDDSPLSYYYVALNKSEIVIGIPYHYVLGAFAGHRIPKRLDTTSDIGPKVFVRPDSTFDFLDHEFSDESSTTEIAQEVVNTEFAVVALDCPNAEQIPQCLLINLDVLENRTLLEKLHAIQYEGTVVPNID